MEAGVSGRPTYLPNSRWTLLWAALLTLLGLGTTIMGLGNFQGGGDLIEKTPGALPWVVSGVLELLGGHFLVRGPARYAKWILAAALLTRMATGVASFYLREFGWSYPPNGGWVEILAFIHALRLSDMDAHAESSPEQEQTA